MNKKFYIQLIKITSAAALLFFLPIAAFALQTHTHSEGIITHQMGHLFFLFSMVVLIFTIREKGLTEEKGWRMLQYGAFLFILWNLNALAAHFLDNQINVITANILSFSRIQIETASNSRFLAFVYYILKLDHLLCVPAMYFVYKGLSLLVQSRTVHKDSA
jgi:hypothetical protein